MNTLLSNMFPVMRRTCFRFFQRDPRVDLRIGSASRSAEKGFTLLEVLIAISVLLVGIVATLVFVNKTISQMSLFSSQLIASYLTQEGIEIVRNIRDTNFLEQASGPNAWDEGLTGCEPGCEADYIAATNKEINLSSFLFGSGRFLRISASGFYGYGAAGTQSKFKRKITIVPQDVSIPLDAEKELIVTVETLWEERGVPNTHKAQEILYNWR